MHPPTYQSSERRTNRGTMNVNKLTFPTIYTVIKMKLHGSICTGCRIPTDHGGISNCCPTLLSTTTTVHHPSSQMNHTKQTIRPKLQPSSSMEGKNKAKIQWVSGKYSSLESKGTAKKRTCRPSCLRHRQQQQHSPDPLFTGGAPASRSMGRNLHRRGKKTLG